ncbi:MAG: restriction endonuclease subunit S [Methanospirillaceae archaeon]|nr:restriction endonuclease subunit S [Methanospirillaceae archaeon]
MMRQADNGDCTVSYQYAKGETLFSLVRGKKSHILSHDSDSDLIPFITIDDLSHIGSDLILYNTRHSIPESEISSLVILDKDALVIPSRRSLLKKKGVRIISKKSAIDKGVIGLIPKGTINPSYLGYYIGSSFFSNLLQKENMQEIPTKFINNHLFPLPTQDMQIIISRLFLTIDKTIEKTDTIIGKTHEALHGLMQGLFSNGVRKTAFINTTIGRIPDTWQVRTLESVCTIMKKGGTPVRSVSEFWQGDIPWVAPTDIIGRKLGDDMEFVTSEAIESAGSWILPAHNILFVSRGPVGASVITEEEMAMHSDIYGIIPGPELEPIFLYWYFFRKERYFTRFRYEKPPSITRKELGSLLIPLPPPDEQRQIASVMNTLDKKLNHEQRYKAHLIKLRNALEKSLFQEPFKNQITF